MKELLLKALSDAIVKLDKYTPLTKKELRSVSIVDVKPIELLQFIEDNNIPKDCCFDGADNGYDAWDDILLSWEVDVVTDKEDRLKFRRKRFTTIAFRMVYDLLTTNGYKRVSYNTGLLKPFDNTTVYDMYINKEFDRLIDYYSLPFTKQ